MRNLLVFLLIILVASCNDKAEKTINMVGAYVMNSQVINDGSKDSAIDRKQLKIYTPDNYIMYASPNVTDSFANFGIGKYKVENGKVYEYIFYRASQGDKKDTNVLIIDKTPNGYKQVIEKIAINGRDYKLTEDYDAVGGTLSSQLNGAWKQVKNIYTTKKGDSSVNNNPLEYKTFQSGYFIWAITTKDSASNRTSVFGYGIFEVDSSNKIKETLQNSTFSRNIGKTYEVAVEFTGDDTYRQTITFANGDKSTEVYQRLKD